MAELYSSTRFYSDPTVTYVGATTATQRTATGDGTSTQTATSVRTCFRTSTGDGTSTQTANPTRACLRTATGSGAGTDTTDWNISPVRTATGFAAGTDAADWNINPVRQASGSGAGTQTASKLIKRFRTATGSGVGTQTAKAAPVKFRSATGSGISTQTPAPFWKSLIFRTPSDNEIALNGFDVDTPWTEEVRVANSLLKFYRPNPRGRNVYKTKAGVYTEREPISTDIDIIYLGGHDNFVTPEEKDNLVAAGYTVT